MTKLTYACGTVIAVITISIIIGRVVVEVKAGGEGGNNNGKGKKSGGVLGCLGWRCGGPPKTEHDEDDNLGNSVTITPRGTRLVTGTHGFTFAYKAPNRGQGQDKGQQGQRKNGDPGTSGST